MIEKMAVYVEVDPLTNVRASGRQSPRNRSVGRYMKTASTNRKRRIRMPDSYPIPAGEIQLFKKGNENYQLRPIEKRKTASMFEPSPKQMNHRFDFPPS